MSSKSSQLKGALKHVMTSKGMHMYEGMHATPIVLTSPCMERCSLLSPWNVGGMKQFDSVICHGAVYCAVHDLHYSNMCMYLKQPILVLIPQFAVELHVYNYSVQYIIMWKCMEL